MQDFLRAPLSVYSERSIGKMVGIGVAATVIGGAFAYVAGPGLVVVGALEAASTSAAATAGAFGLVTGGVATDRIWKERMVDENYEQVLKFVTAEFFKRLQQEVNLAPENEELKKKMRDVSDLLEDGSTFNVEKAMLLMYDPEAKLNNFSHCDLDKCIEASKKEVLKRIECISAVHQIRGHLAKQCYVGIVGVQDAGKTTLLNKLWSVGGSGIGHFRHTDMPTVYELNDPRVLIVDFPGSNSLDYHADTFSICGAMNNLIIVVIPYTGDISRLIGSEVANVFEVMAGSESAEIILCVNKCGYELPDALKNELAQDHESPIEYLKQRFAARLHEFYDSKGTHYTVQQDRIFFTDWKVGDNEEMNALGICGAEAIKEEIKTYLIRNNIFSLPAEQSKLNDCFLPMRRRSNSGGSSPNLAQF